MKKILFIIAIFLVLGFQKYETSVEYSSNDIMKYLQENTVEGYCIMQELLENYDGNTTTNGEKHSPSEYLELFIKDAKSTLDSINGVGTLIHESIHRLNKSDFINGNYYFLNCNKNIRVKHTNTFKSRKIIEVIPDSCRTFRFDHYINIKGRHVTQVDGIYGLLNEFNAYYKGAQSKYDFKPHINDSLYLEGIVGSEMQAYYEFKYYIITYLIYAEENHNRKFNAIINNDNFNLHNS